ncbi:MAG: hypothetical protein LBF88_06680 [Planctomycetaceae bacterium]|jgi:hypothetical protein|nr:hypothetical protein [Planctomycetaceae bacterium]
MTNRKNSEETYISISELEKQDREILELIAQNGWKCLRLTQLGGEKVNMKLYLAISFRNIYLLIPGIDPNEKYKDAGRFSYEELRRFFSQKAPNEIKLNCNSNDYCKRPALVIRELFNNARELV